MTDKPQCPQCHRVGSVIRIDPRQHYCANCAYFFTEPATPEDEDDGA